VAPGQFSISSAMVDTGRLPATMQPDINDSSQRLVTIIERGRLWLGSTNK
jgi:hypothetical protein